MNLDVDDEKILEFFSIIMNLKNIKRSGWYKRLGITKPESVADHSYSVAFLSMIISDLEKYNSKKVLQMSLLHDLAESAMGDFTPENRPINKYKIENQIMIKILCHLPKYIRKTYLDLWNEYNEKKTRESILVHNVDKFELAYQAIIYSKNKKLINTFLINDRNMIQNKKLKIFFDKISTELY